MKKPCLFEQGFYDIIVKNEEGKDEKDFLSYETWTNPCKCST